MGSYVRQFVCDVSVVKSCSAAIVLISGRFLLVIHRVYKSWKFHLKNVFKKPLTRFQSAKPSPPASETPAPAPVPPPAVVAPTRPIAWEDDISRNTLDSLPFQNRPAPSEYAEEDFLKLSRMYVIGPLLGERKLGELMSRDTFPIPSAEDREGFAPGDDGLYWLSGLEDYLKIQDVAWRYGNRQQSVLDFGCASGRVLRHFAAQSSVTQLWGSDINARHIRWLHDHLPLQVKPIFNHCLPTLPLRDQSVDLITAFSVFTHIDTFETSWLAELSRIMHDDGLCYVTVHNEDTWQACRNEIDNPDNRLVQSILACDPAVRDKIREPLAEGRTVYRFTPSGPYRSQVFHSNSYLHNVWGRFFNIREILPSHHVRQTVLVLTKK